MKALEGALLLTLEKSKNRLLTVLCLTSLVRPTLLLLVIYNITISVFNSTIILIQFQEWTNRRNRTNPDCHLLTRNVWMTRRIAAKSAPIHESLGVTTLNRLPRSWKTRLMMKIAGRPPFPVGYRWEKLMVVEDQVPELDQPLTIWEIQVLDNVYSLRWNTRHQDWIGRHRKRPKARKWTRKGMFQAFEENEGREREFRMFKVQSAQEFWPNDCQFDEINTVQHLKFS